jgi:hypothetical protein
MQFLWFYVPGPDNGMELRYSIRSVIQNFGGDAKVTVIGDRPDWYRGHHIPLGRHSNRSRRDRDAFLDTQRKIVHASTHPEIEDEFVWIMDDVYLLQPVTIDDLKTPRYDPWYRVKSVKEWHRLIATTFSALKQNGKTQLQYGTHLPHHVEKQRLIELFRIYDYPKNLYLWEILYGNHYRSGARPYGGNWEGVEYPYFLKRILGRPRKITDIESATSASHVLNYQAPCWCRFMKEFLGSKFPTKTEFEA